MGAREHQPDHERDHRQRSAAVEQQLDRPEDRQRDAADQRHPGERHADGDETPPRRARRNRSGSPTPRRQHRRIFAQQPLVGDEADQLFWVNVSAHRS